MNTRLDEPARFNVERETVAFGGGVVPAAEKGEVFLFIDEEDVGVSFVQDDLAAMSLREQVSVRWGARRARIYLDVARDLTPPLRHASMEAKLDWDTIFDKERVVVASDGERSLDHVDGGQRSCGSSSE